VVEMGKLVDVEEKQLQGSLVTQTRARGWSCDYPN